MSLTSPALPSSLPPKRCKFTSTSDGSHRPLPHGALGKYAAHAESFLQGHCWAQFVRRCATHSTAQTLRDLPHNTAAFLHRLSTTGVPAPMMSTPWTLDQKDHAIHRGVHQSATQQYRSYLEDEMAAMVEHGYWCVLPYRAVRSLPSLKISPVGVVPQRERRPRPIIDYTWSGVNGDTAPIAPFSAMQFGSTLQRILQKIAYANPTFGPVQMLKCDLSDGFYRIPLAPSAIPHLGVILPSSPGEEPLLAFPLNLPMGWKHSPPYFSAFTETIADITNKRLASPLPVHPPAHRLDSVQPSTFPPCAKHWVTPRHHPFNTAPPTQPLRWVDIYVDDFIALAQEPETTPTRRTLLHTIDTVFRPPKPGITPTIYKDPISLSKLDKGDLEWGTTKRILGWDLDSVAGTISLPPHRAQRLCELLLSFITLRRTSRTKWQQLLGELRSMALAIPGAGYLFSTLQHPLTAQPNSHRIRLSALTRATLADWCSLADHLASQPTNIITLIPTAPSYVGACDASGSGMGGVWFPTTLARGGTAPLIWRTAFPTSITASLCTHDNPTGSVTNSDLELLAIVSHIQHLQQHRDLSNDTLLLGSDNSAAVAWCNKQSTTTTGPAAFLLRHLGLLSRRAQLCPRVVFVPGSSNTIADFLSRSFHLSDDMVAHHLSTSSDLQTSFQWLRLNTDKLSQLTSCVSRQLLPMESLRLEPPGPMVLGPPGAPSAPPPTSTHTSTLFGIPSIPSFSSPTSTEPAKFLPVEILSAARRWLMPFVPWDRRWPSWGKRIPV